MISSVATVLVASQSKADAAVNVHLTCIATAPVVGDQAAENDLALDVVAPPVVKEGQNFTISAETPAGNMPTEQGGYGLTSMANFMVKIPVPPNSSYVSSSLSGGSGTLGTPTLAYESGAVVLRVPGPIAGGAAYQFPKITIVLKASGAVGSTIEPRIGGTSKTDPGFSLTANVTGIPLIGSASVPTACWPATPNPALSSTVIIPTVNTIPPSITINTPGDGLQYPKNANVKANYTCTAEPYYGGLRSCVGTVANGASIDTSTLGTHSFTVNAEDNDGLTSSKTVHYEVVAPGGDLAAPTIDITTPPDGAVFHQGAVVNAAFTCADASSGVASCVGTVGAGSPIDTSTVGAHSFTVTATDNAGNQAQSTHGYTVIDGGAGAGPGAGANLGMGSGNPPNVNGAAVRWKVTAPASNGGQLIPGESVTVEWSLFKATAGCSTTANTQQGSDPITWVLDAPANTQIVPGSVTATLTDLDGHSKGDAHAGSDFVGLKVDPPASSGAQATISWDSNSKPGTGLFCLLGTNRDGVIIKVSYQVTVTGTTGNVTIPGFPAGKLTGKTQSGANWTAAAIAAPGVSFGIASFPPPTITINSPVDGGHVDYQSTVLASYGCQSSVGIASCTGTVANGAAINTSTGGSNMFTVTAVDNNGLTSGRSVSYIVDVPPPVAVNDTAQAAWSGSVDVDVLANDFSPYGTSPSFWDIDPTSVTIVTPPQYGTATVLPNGQIRYQNADGANTPDTIEYQISNLLGDLSNTATVTVNMGIDTCAGDPGGSGCPLYQLIIVPVEPDIMSMSQAANSATLDGVLGATECEDGPVKLNGEPQVACGELQHVTVVNSRGTDTKWDLTGQVTDFNDDTRNPGESCSTQASFDNHCVPGGNLGWTPSAAVTHMVLPGDVATVAPGATVNLPTAIPQPAVAPNPLPGLKDAAQMLCNSPSKHSGGTFGCDARLYLYVPASAAAGTYTAVLTLTLA